MNVALPAIVLFLLLLPGFVFRSRLKRVERTSLDYSPFGQVVTEGIGWAGLLHALWLTGAYFLLSQRLQTEVLIGLVGSDQGVQAAAIRHLKMTDKWVAAYFGSLYLSALFAGGIARTAISRFHLDRAGGRLASVFRFSQAPWYYLLTASDLSEEDQPDLILASAIVEIGKEAFLYSGVVEHYYVSEDGELDRLVLSGASRRPMSADKESPSQSREDRFYSIDGDFFVLRFSEAVTLNIQYVRLQELSAMTPMAEPASPQTQAPRG